MSEYSHCSICGGSFVGIGNVCPGCEYAISREPLEIRPIELKTRRHSADEAARSHAMSNGNKETIADIITEASGVFAELRKHGYNVVSVERMADIIDRIEAAAKREREAEAKGGAE